MHVPPTHLRRELGPVHILPRRKKLPPPHVRERGRNVVSSGSFRPHHAEGQRDRTGLREKASRATLQVGLGVHRTRQRPLRHAIIARRYQAAAD